MVPSARSGGHSAPGWLPDCGVVFPAPAILGLAHPPLRYIASERSLVEDSVADETLAAKVRQRWVVIVLNLAAIVIAIVAPLVAVGLYLIMTFVALALPLIHLRRRRR